MRNIFITIFGRFFEWPEFLFGVLIGILLTMLAGRLEPITSALTNRSRKSIRGFGERFSSISIDRFRGDLLRQVRRMHVMQNFFQLDEIVIPPHLLVPPPAVDPTSEEAPAQNTLSVLPNLPDWKYLSGLYCAPSIPVTHAVTSGSSFMITGELGSGKTTALAYVGMLLARHDERMGEAVNRTPMFVHAGNLFIGKDLLKDPIQGLVRGAQASSDQKIGSKLPGVLRPALRDGTAILLLDGLDELPRDEIAIVMQSLARLQKEQPGNQIVAAGPVDGYDGVAAAGLLPVPIAPWTEHDQRLFMTRWSEAWQQHIAPLLPKRRMGELDPALITGWLIGSVSGLTPLDITLRLWAAYTGDVRGSRNLDSLQAYVERIISRDERQTAEAVGRYWLRKVQAAVPERELPRGTPVNDLVASGLLVRRAGNKVSFQQPAVGAYLAAKALQASGELSSISAFGWPPVQHALTYLAAKADMAGFVKQALGDTADPLKKKLLTCGRWLREAPTRIPWRADILRALGQVVNDVKLPYGLRLRATHALAFSHEPSVEILFKRMLGSDHAANRVLGALGLGGLLSEENVQGLARLLQHDPSLPARRAAALALAVIGTDEALETLGQTLLQGDEDVRLASAEALACHPDEGYNMLKDAAEIDNLLTRRAAVFGLARVPEDWAAAVLEHVQLEDDQWVVRGAAAEAGEQRRISSHKLAPPVGEISELPWLIDFAARQGLGVAPGKAALEMVRRALTKGSPEEQVAALEAIAWSQTDELNLELTQALKSGLPHLRDAAFEALWQMDASGTAIPSQQMT